MPVVATSPSEDAASGPVVPSDPSPVPTVPVASDEPVVPPATDVLESIAAPEVDVSCAAIVVAPLVAVVSGPPESDDVASDEGMSPMIPGEGRHPSANPTSTSTAKAPTIGRVGFERRHVTRRLCMVLSAAGDDCQGATTWQPRWLPYADATVLRAWIVVGWLQPAPGSDAAIELEWTAPAACPDREDVLARVEALLPAAPSGDAAPVRARATIVADPAGSTLVLDIDGLPTGAGRRELTAADCDELTDAAALLLALAIDPAAAVAAPEPVTPPPLAVAAPPTRPAPRGSPPTPRAPVTSIALRPELGLSLGAPAPAGLYAGGALGVVRRRWRIELAGRHHVVSRGSLAAIASDAALRASLTTVSARGCATRSWTSMALHGCAGVVGGVMIGRGSGLPGAQRSAKPYLAASVAIATTWRIHDRVGLWIEAALTPVIVRPGYAVSTVAGPRRVYRTAAIAGAVGGGLEIRLR